MGGFAGDAGGARGGPCSGTGCLVTSPLRPPEATGRFLYAKAPGTSVVSLTPAELAQCPWLGPTLPARPRVDMSLSKMSLADKIVMTYDQPTGHDYEGYLEGLASLSKRPYISRDDPAEVGAGAANAVKLPGPERLAAALGPGRCVRVRHGVNAIEPTESASTWLFQLRGKSIT